MNTLYSEKQITKLSRLCSLLLRHAPEKAGLTMDENGWVKVDELIKNVSKYYFLIGKGLLKAMVETNDKQRFTFSDDGTKIRANQGHSIEIDLQLEEHEPPETLYHGTATRNLTSIFKNGINKGNRHEVHLSTAYDTAIQVGQRHGNTIVLHIDARQMYEDGHKFFVSKNGVWLTDFIPSQYIRRL